MSTLALASRDVLVHAPAAAIGASAEFYTWLKPHSCHLLPCTSYKHVDNEEKKNRIISIDSLKGQRSQEDNKQHMRQKQNRRKKDKAETA
ncbi:hypothetical protein Q3G72_006006 [Acer saccharum]|nr:hypothetical protein Q3G72_006006 [Acer saccharum]